MATYTKETALYDTGKIGSDISDAGETASKYITAVDQNGIKVHAENGTNVNYSLINGEGLEVFQGTSASDSKSVAKFGSIARVGSEDDASITITGNSVMGVGTKGSQFFNFADSESTMKVSRKKSFYLYTSQPEFPSTPSTALTVDFEGTLDNSYSPRIETLFYKTGVGSSGTVTTTFTYGTANTKTWTVTLDGVTYSFTATYNGSSRISDIRTTSVVPKDDTVELRIAISYGVIAPAPSYEIGGNLQATGGYAFAEGFATKAEGDYSHAEGNDTGAYAPISHAEGNMSYAYSSAEVSHVEGYWCETRARYSHAEGNGTTAQGEASHAEGDNCITYGEASHAQNMGTSAKMDAQTAIGTYNIEDSAPTTAVHPNGFTKYGNYAFIIGNGTGTNSASRSNALTVDWQGNVKAAGEVAGVVHTYGAITGGTWSSKSIGTGSTWKELANFTIPEDGVWLLIAQLIYASNATGHRTMSIATSSASSGVGIYTDRRQAINGTETPLRVVILVEGNTKYYVNTYHGASSALSCQGRYTAFKIGNSVNKIGG